MVVPGQPFQPVQVLGALRACTQAVLAERLAEHGRRCLVEWPLAGQGLLGWGPHVTASRLDFGLLPCQRLIYFPNVASLR
jgi:hypothetical protein